ncbi:hypothetical protein BDR03DRAFT_961180 [Suillus americanus]|nr:hypothetical protein BDR03DRAFT_961180 [Suillus americanus]
MIQIRPSTQVTGSPFRSAKMFRGVSGSVISSAYIGYRYGYRGLLFILPTAAWSIAPVTVNVIVLLQMIMSTRASFHVAIYLTPTYMHVVQVLS